MPRLAVMDSLSSISDSGGTSWASVSIVRRLLEVVPRGVFLMYFRDVEVTTPVIGQSGCLIPTVDVSIVVRSHMTNNAMEEKFGLAVPLYSPSIDFRHHKATVWGGDNTSLKMWV